jgi:hypothetical protein
MRDLLLLLDQLGRRVETVRRLIEFWQPVTAGPTLVKVLVALASVLAVGLLSGIAVSSLAMLVLALSALLLVITEVFGLSIELDLR